MSEIREAVHKKVTAFLKSRPAGLVQRFDLSDMGKLEGFLEALQTRSFFGEDKILLITGSFFKEEIAEQVLATLGISLGSLEKGIELVFHDTEIQATLEKKHKKLFAFLNKKADSTKTFVETKGVKLEKLIEDKLKEEGLSIARPALSRLVGALAAYPDRLDQELAKIIAYKKYQGPLRGEQSAKIEDKEVAQLVATDTILNNFALADAIAARDHRQGLELLYRHLTAGEDPYAILGLLIYQFRNLLKIKSLTKAAVPYAELVAKTKLHPFVVKKTYEQAKSFDLEELKNIYQRLFAIEVGMKGGYLDPALILYDLILRV